MNNMHGRFIAASALLLASAHPISAATRCVAPGGARGCFSSINAAIAAAAPGDTVQIYDGRYFENVIIDKSITLTGSVNVDDSNPSGEEGGQHPRDRRERGAVIMPDVSNPNPCSGSSLCGGLASNIVLVRANNVTIRNLTFDGDNPHLTSGIVRDGADLDARNGIITDHRLGTFNDLTVFNVTIRNIYWRGMAASSGGTFNFHHNAVQNVQGDAFAIAMFNFGGAGRMTDNKVARATDALSSNWSRGVQFLNNEVRESGSGLHTDNSGGLGVGAGDVIRGNTVRAGMPGAYGIWVFVPYVLVTVSDNEVADVDVGLAAFGQGTAVTTRFTDNAVEGRPPTGSTGVFVTTDLLGYGQSNVSARFSRNRIGGFENGFVLESAPLQTIAVDATCNAVAHVAGRGVIAGGLVAESNIPGVPPSGSGLQQIRFSQNNIRGQHAGLENRGSATIDARMNWWGCSSGPGTRKCSSVIGPVNFTPWLTEPAECTGDEDSEDR
jgi:hypothetical protein